MLDLRGERNGLLSRPTERLAEAGQHRQIGVKLDALQATDTERRQRVLGLEPSELALDGRAPTVQLAEAPTAARDERRLAGSVRRDGWREPLGIWVVPHRDNRAHAEVEALAVNPVVVIALIH